MAVGGRGKTFFIKELWSALSGRKEITFKKVEYQAWKYQETPASWAYLYEEICDCYLGEKKGHWKRHYFRLAKLNIKRIGILPLFKLILSAIISIGIAIILYPAVTNKVAFVFGASATVLLVLSIAYKEVKKSYSTKAIELIKKYTVRNSYKAVMGIQAEIQEELIKLFTTWIPENNKPEIKNKWYQTLYQKIYDYLDEKFDKETKCEKILLVIEDIDRCAEEKIIPNIDALRVMLDNAAVSKRVVVITAIDLRILREAIRKKYDHLEIIPDGSTGYMDKLVGEYLDKLFISSIKLGDLNAVQKEEYLKVLFKKEIAAVEIVEETVKEMTMETIAHENSLPTENDRTPDSPVKSNTSANANSTASSPEAIKSLPPTDKLLPIEIAALTRVVTQWEDATPRKISIFYYRYLLCKNLLIDKYARTTRINPWQKGDGVEALFYLLKKFHDDPNPDKIAIQISSMKSASGFQAPLSSGKFFTPAIEDYVYLLEILEIVIAY